MWIRPVSAFHKGSLARSKVAPTSTSIAPPAWVCLDKNCPLSVGDCDRRCTVVKDLGSSASSGLPKERMGRQETICQRANSARPRPPLRSTKMLRSSARVFAIVSGSSQLQNVRGTQFVNRAPRCSVVFYCVPSSKQAELHSNVPRTSIRNPPSSTSKTFIVPKKEGRDMCVVAVISQSQRL